MPKVKTLLVILFVIAFSFSLLGCGLITSRTASTDEVVETGGQVPEWLLLSHRSIASEENDIDDELAAIDEEDEETDEAVGGVDEDDGVTAESGQTEQATSEVAQAAETGSSGSTQQASSGSTSTSGKSEKQQFLESLQPGSREYLVYLNNRKHGESKEEFVDRMFEEAKKAAEKEKEESLGFEDRESPSGWGN